MSISEKLLSQLKDPTLLPAAGLVGGQWIDNVASGKRFDIDNPATGEVIASLPDMGAEETRQAVNVRNCRDHVIP